MRSALLIAAAVGCAGTPTPAPTPAIDNRGDGPTCVDDFVVDAAERLGVAPADVSGADLPDLDRDGTENEFRYYAWDQCGTGGCVYQAYLRRGTCATWIGTLAAHGDLVLGDDGPMPTITTRWDLGCCQYVEQRHAWNGERYVPTTERTCGAADGESVTACERWHPADAPP